MAYNRKLIVLKLRWEGAYAAAQGQSAESCPHKYMDKYQWLAGYNGFWGTVEECLEALMRGVRKNDSIKRIT